MKAWSDTKAAVLSNWYATDKRGARRAQILIYRRSILFELFCLISIIAHSIFIKNAKFAFTPCKKCADMLQ